MCQNTMHKIFQMALYKEQDWDIQTQDIPPGGPEFLFNVKPRLYVDLF